MGAHAHEISWDNYCSFIITWGKLTLSTMVYYYLEKGMGRLENKKSMIEYGYHTKSLLSMFCETLTSRFIIHECKAQVCICSSNKLWTEIACATKVIVCAWQWWGTFQMWPPTTSGVYISTYLANLSMSTNNVTHIDMCHYIKNDRHGNGFILGYCSPN